MFAQALSILALAGAMAQPAAPPAAVRLSPSPPPALRAPPASIPRPTEPARIRVSDDGSAIIVMGAIGPGSATRFADALEANPNVRTIALYSSGGIMAEAERIAGVVRARALATYVEISCMSACTLILVAGADRAAAPTARIGFHRPIFTGRTEGTPLGLRLARSFYERAGIPSAFTDRVMATPNSEMWFPTYEEMIAAKVLTRRTLGGETNAAFSLIGSRAELRQLLGTIPYWRSLETRFPDIANATLDAAWAVKERGGTDAEIGTAGRLTLMNHLPRILVGASDEVMDRFLTLIVRQARAAREISVEACALLARGELNPTLNLPRELVLEELELTTAALNAPANPVPFDRPRAERLLRQVMADLPMEQLGAIGSIGDAAADIPPDIMCDAATALYERVQALPQAERVVVIRFMLLSPI